MIEETDPYLPPSALDTKNIKTLLLKFFNGISAREVSYFRAAIIKLSGSEDVLFHNHVGDSFRYSYPLIQYKRIDGRAVIFCIDEGIEAIKELLPMLCGRIQLGKRGITLELSNRQDATITLRIDTQYHHYHIMNYLPLNQRNYQIFHGCDSIIEKCSLLEHCLIGNILSFAKCVGVYFKDHIDLKLESYESPRPVIYKGVNMLAFDLRFKTNVVLPNYIGLGKGESIGYGIVTSKDKYN